MKTLARLTLSTLFALLAIPHQAFAQPAAPQPPAPADPAGQPTPPPTDATQPATPAQPDSAAQPPAPAQPTPPKADPTVARGMEWSSLRLLREKGVISEAEYASAMKDFSGIGSGSGDSATLVVSKLKVTLFGFTQADFEFNSTQSCLEFCSHFPIQKKGTYRGNHSRMVFSPRDTRFAVRFQAPEEHGIRASGLIETDFFGPTTTSEAGTWTNPVLRIRHSYLKLETPIVDLTIGQTGNLFGWGSAYLVTGGQEPSLPGQMYQRTNQLRISKTIRGGGVIADLAFAAERPVQMDSTIPELVGGVRLQFEKWTGFHTFYLSASVVQPASIAVTADFRGFRIPKYSTTLKGSNFLAGGGIAVDAYLPIIPATKKSKTNALSISGELVIGAGIHDMYVALGGAGTVIPPIPPTTPGGMATPYVPNFDTGYAAYRADGHLELIKWTGYMVGAEFYPGALDGRLGLDINYGHQQSKNTKKFATPATATAAYGAGTRDHENFFGAGGFFDPTKQTRVGADFGIYDDHYVDGSNARNYSVITSAWLFF